MRARVTRIDAFTGTVIDMEMKKDEKTEGKKKGRKKGK